MADQVATGRISFIRHPRTRIGIAALVVAVIGVFAWLVLTAGRERPNGAVDFFAASMGNAARRDRGKCSCGGWIVALVAHAHEHLPGTQGRHHLGSSREQRNDAPRRRAGHRQNVRRVDGRERPGAS